ncbi:sugar phosphate isomerase/epimerase family protein [Sediminibacillus halophilus]|uniref:Fatty-acyl-CoA synthase n=1 Tax=Sediminibacillus halophilus TaxID=482461 RepID=A0A1G9NNB2_9BACI|nr:sugar phosphate isomerase/epimerase family protein [Sediminibacillus halophilus]SDL87527.1 fatty-acyl-CoA synthase [Sediminibacillus halophilus]
MKLAFTTLGCPKWNLDTMITYAVENGFQGIDFRGFQGEMDIFRTPAFSSQREETKQKFDQAGLEIPCFSSSVRLYTKSAEQFQTYMEELKNYAKLCQFFHTPYIRVFGGTIGDIAREQAVEIVEQNLKGMLAIAEEYQITLLLETHDDWTDCGYVEEVLQRARSPYLQVLWDVHHPYRIAGETPEQTWERLGGHIRYTHWKDSYKSSNNKKGYQLCLMGEGDMPLQRIFQLLQTKGFKGYFTLEWEKVWWPDIEEPEVALPQYAAFMREMG